MSETEETTVKPIKEKRKNLDREVVNKFKQEAETAMSSHASFVKHKEEVDGATLNRKS